MLTIVQTYSKELAAITAVVLAFGLNRFLRLRPVLRYGVLHSFNFLADHTVKDEKGDDVPQAALIRTASISLVNTGLTPAKNVEVTFNWKPAFLNVWPTRHFTTKDSAHNRHTLSLDSLAPGEAFGIEMLAIGAELPVITALRCDEAEGKLVPMQPQQVQQTWKIAVALILMMIGLGTIGDAIAWIVQRLMA